MSMRLYGSREILNRYKNEIDCEIESLYFSRKDNRLMGYSFLPLEFEINRFRNVAYVNEERNYRKIWKIDGDALRIGSGKKDAFDKGILGYVCDENHNIRIVYSEEICNESFAKENGISLEDAYDHWYYNVIGSLYGCDLKHKPIIVSTMLI